MAANFAAEDLEAFGIWRLRTEERLQLLEQQLQELRGTLALLVGKPGKEAANGRDYLRLLNVYLTDDDVRELAFRFQVDYDGLVGESGRGRLLSLVQEMERAGRLYQLEQAVRKLRPNVDWPVFV